MTKAALLRTCFEVMHRSGVSASLRPFFRGMGVIFCLHHVCPGGGQQRGFAPNSNLEVPPEFLNDIIGLVRGQGYQLLSLTDAVERIRSGNSSSPFAVFTLDDGYRDNLVHALPVFRRNNCPFTVFVSPRIAEGTCELWWRALEALIAESASLDLNIAGETLRIETRDDAGKRLAWRKLFPLVQKMPEYEQRTWIRRYCEDKGIDVDALCRACAMDWEEIRTLASEKLATIGAHTLNHHNLMRMDEVDARREIVESGRWIAAELGKPVEHFAYPYGNTDAAGPREFRLCAEAGYTSAVTTRLGVIFPGHKDHMLALPRIMVSGRYQKIRYIDTLISGLPGAMANRFRKINVA